MINLGFVGVGGYGRAQLDSFLPFHRSGRVKICAMADVSREALVAASGIEELRGTGCFDDYATMLMTEDLDAVVISAPIPLHEEITLLAAERGLFVLLEKPPAPLLSQLERLINADAQGRIMVGFQHIYSPLLRRMKQIVWSGEIGRPLAFSGFGLWPRTTDYYDRAGWAGKIWSRDRITLDGPFTNGMSHFVNSLFFVAGSTPTGYALPDRLEGEAYRARPIASYDLGGMGGQLDNGCAFHALFSHAAAEAMPVRLGVRGTEGNVALSDNNKFLKDHRGETTRGSDGRSELLLAFLDLVEGKTESNLTPLIAMRAYVLATNMMFLSSGGIHSIADRFLTIHRPATPESLYEVTGLKALIDQWSEGGILPSTSGAPWSVAPRSVERTNFDESRMLALLERN